MLHAVHQIIIISTYALIAWYGTATAFERDELLSGPMRNERHLWEYTLPIYAARRSMQNCCGKRLLRALRALDEGKPANIAVVGGSYSVPDRILMEDVWFSLVVKYLRARYPRANITAVNAAVGASNAGFAFLCLAKMIPPEVDLVFLDYGPNMLQRTHEMIAQNQYYEQLIRAILAHPGDPAVIAVEQLLPPVVQFYRIPEITSAPLYKYYDIPYVSVATSLWRLQARNVSGFREQDIRVTSDGAAWNYWHLNRRGHKLVADMVVFMLQTAVASDQAGIWPGQRDPFWTDEFRRSREHPPLLPPHPVKRPVLCVMPEELPTFVTSNTGWEFGADDKKKRKFGFISFNNATSDSAAGATAAEGMPELLISWDGRAVGASVDAVTYYTLVLVYLASYNLMGTANLTCAGACECKPQAIGATISEFSLTKAWPVALSLRPGPTGSLVCQLTVLNNSPGGDHAKFKVQGFILAEMQPGMESEIGKVVFMNHEGVLKTTGDEG